MVSLGFTFFRQYYIINLIGFELTCMCTMSNDINHVLYMYIYALQLENTSESDPHSYEATKTVAKKAQKNSEVLITRIH